MYPFLRMIRVAAAARRAPPLGAFDTHHSSHICWPWDLDVWMELNNGRTLSIFDLGRIPLGIRSGLVATLKQKRWGLTVAGSVVRYRRRVRMFDRVDMRSRMIGWDARFMYIEQAMFHKNGECTSHAMFRTAVTSAQGIVAPARVFEGMGHVDMLSPQLPDWVDQWIASEDARPWPPMRDACKPGAQKP